MDVHRPQGNGREHPKEERFKRCPILLVREGMEPPDVILGIFPPVVGEDI
jgi:hypothetical protein